MLLKLNECLLWTLHARPAKSSQTVWGQSVHFFPLLCVSPRYLIKCLWLKILSNKIIQVYNRHCKTIIMSCNSGNIILMLFLKMNKWTRWIILGFINSGSFDYELPLKYWSLKISSFSEIHTTKSLNVFFFNLYIYAAHVCIKCFKNILILQNAFRFVKNKS